MQRTAVDDIAWIGSVGTTTGVVEGHFGDSCWMSIINVDGACLRTGQCGAVAKCILVNLCHMSENVQLLELEIVVVESLFANLSD